MKIDYAARERLARHQEQKGFMNSIMEKIKLPPEKPDTITEPMKNVESSTKSNLTINTFLLTMVQKIFTLFSQVAEKLPSVDDVKSVERAIKAIEFPKPEDQITVNPQQVKEITSSIKGIVIPESPKEISVSNLDAIITELSSIRKQLPKSVDTVTVKNLPKIDLKPIVDAIVSLRSDLQGVKKEKTVKDTSTPVQPINLDPVIELLGDLRLQMQRMVEKDIIIPDAVDIRNFPPQMVPTPVTHISLNALQGYIKTTSVTVGTSLATVPGYGVLSNRRSIIIYNNSNATIYVGGSDVTTTNGMPVPPNSYSPILDAGVNVIMYAIASSSNNNIRVLEISDEASGR